MKTAKKILMTVLCGLIIVMCVNNLFVARLNFNVVNVATDIFGIVASIFAIISVYNKKFTSHTSFKIILFLLIVAVAGISGYSGYKNHNGIMMILAALFLAIGFRLIVILKTQKRIREKIEEQQKNNN